MNVKSLMNSDPSNSSSCSSTELVGHSPFCENYETILKTNVKLWKCSKETRQSMDTLNNEHTMLSNKAC